MTTDTEALQQMATQKLAGFVQAAIYDLSDGRRFPDLMAAVVELERRAEHAAAKADAAHVGTPEAWINWNAATETTLRAAQPAPQQHAATQAAQDVLAARMGGDAKHAEMDEVEHAAINRYRPVPAGVLAYAVVAGDGTRKLFTGTKDECHVVARKLTEAFLDGAHMAISARTPHVAETPEQEQDESDVSLGVTGAGPVAVLRFERGTPGRENEMPRVVSCDWLPDGEYHVYLATQPAVEQGEPFGYFRAEPFGWTDCAEGDEGAVALYEKAGATDATLHKIINNVEAALDAAGAPAGTRGEDAARLDWLTFNISGKALRDIGVIWSEHGDARRAIDAARTQTEIDMIGTQSTGAGANHA